MPRIFLSFIVERKFVDVRFRSMAQNLKTVDSKNNTVFIFVSLIDSNEIRRVQNFEMIFFLFLWIRIFPFSRTQNVSWRQDDKQRNFTFQQSFAIHFCWRMKNQTRRGKVWRRRRKLFVSFSKNPFDFNEDLSDDFAFRPWKLLDFQGESMDGAERDSFHSRALFPAHRLGVRKSFSRTSFD